jgi:4-alpha-glucanotransferase
MLSSDKWEKIGTAKRAGTLVPLFSVYSQDSLGIGDLKDLKLLIDWSAKIGSSIIQLLPMNELGPLFCPYDSFSSFALEPVFISLSRLCGSRKKSIQDEIRKIKMQFPVGRPYVDYGIKEQKLRLLWKIFPEEKSGNCAELFAFRQKNEYWLDDFALFKALKEHHQGRPWYEWEDKYKNRDSAALGLFRKEHAAEIDFQCWVQWVAFSQFSQAKAYAASRGILLKGDLPILVSRDSADVWAHPEFFKLEFAAGAPPDMYCAKGQRWGMPTYNWENIADDGYRYLKEKLAFAGNFYDVLRIDHVVGLFRIWSIPYNEPMENQGLNGSFDPVDENKWEAHGKDILSVMLASTGMLICAEDLGVIPPVCTKTLGEFGIPGNDVQRWMKDWKVRHDFLGPEDYRLFSVSMLSTHDTTNWPAWWENEAGTVDEGLFVRKCRDRGIDYNQAKARLFDPARSRHGRLRWLDSITCVESMVNILGKRKEEAMDFIDIYENTYQEKEKLWKQLGFSGPMREKPDGKMVAAALKITLESRSIFSIQLLTDWLYLGGLFKGDPYQYRINTPGIISAQNWSLTFPISLEELLRHRVSQEIKKMISACGRSLTHRAPKPRYL